MYGYKLKRVLPQIGLFMALCLCYLTGTGESLQHGLTDLRFKISPRPASGKIALVAIDAKSIQALGAWPWPRQVHGQLLEKLKKAQVGEIAFDVDFSAPSTSLQDASLAASLEKMDGAVILPVFKQFRSDHLRQEIQTNTPLEIFKNKYWPATVNVFSERNGLVRQVSYGEKVNGHYTPSLSAMLGGRYQPKKQSFFIDYSIDPKTVPVVSYIDVLEGRFKPEIFKNRKVMIGGTAIELGDRFAVPVNGLLAGPMVQIMGAETLLQNRQLQQTGFLVFLTCLLIVFTFAHQMRHHEKLLKKLFLFVALGAVLESLAVALHIYYAINVDTFLLHVCISVLIMLKMFYEVDFTRLVAKMADADRENTQRVMQQVINDSSAGFIVVNEDRNIRFTSKSAIEILTLEDRPTLSGKNYRDVLPKDFIRIGEPLWENEDNFNKNNSHSREITLEQKDGSRKILEVIVTPSLLKGTVTPDGSKIEDERVISYTFSDITEKKMAEEAIQRAAEAAIAANETKTDFIANMSHELRTPLNAIIGFSELIANQSLGPIGKDCYAEYAGHINNSGSQLLKVLNDILEISTIENKEIDIRENHFHLEDVMRLSLNDLRGEIISRDIEISLPESENLPEILGDEYLCRKMFTHILSNAVKFSDDNAKIFVDAVETEKGEFKLSIRDFGSGMPHEMVEQVKQAFFQAESSKNRTHEGSGLGLTLANAYIKAHQGRIRIESDLDKGTTVHIYFPSERVTYQPVQSSGPVENQWIVEIAAEKPVEKLMVYRGQQLGETSATQNCSPVEDVGEQAQETLTYDEVPVFASKSALA